MSSIIKRLDKRTGITYVYESTSYWDKEKKQPRSKRVLIGKLDPDTGRSYRPMAVENAAKSGCNRNLIQFLKNKGLSLPYEPREYSMERPICLIKLANSQVSRLISKPVSRIHTSRYSR